MIALATTFVCLFLISLFTLSYVQIRVMRKSGWRALGRGSLVELYWKDLTALERWLLWPGIVCFMFLALLASGSLIWEHLQQ